MAKLTSSLLLAGLVGLSAISAQAQTGNPPAPQRYGSFAAPAKLNLTAATLNAGIATSNVALPANSVTYPTLYLFNTGAVALFFNLGPTNAVTAAVSNVPLPAGATMCLAAMGNAYLAAITASSTATLYIVQGQGCPSR